MYGKIFRSMYDGSLCENWQALVTFQQMIILSDSEGIVDMTPEAISRTTNIPLDIIAAGIEELEKPDPSSRTPTEEGKRIVRMDEHRAWGWKLVNHTYYKNLASYEDKKKADRERIARQRKQEKEKDNDGVATCSEESQNVANVAHTDKDKDKDKDTHKEVSKYLCNQCGAPKKESWHEVCSNCYGQPTGRVHPSGHQPEPCTKCGWTAYPGYKDMKDGLCLDCRQ